MIPLDLICYAKDIQQRHSDRGLELFCTVRNKWLIAQPEEWVRQTLLRYLSQEKKWPLKLLAVEKAINSNYRWDVAAYSSSGELRAIIECKRPEKELDWKDFFQQLSYNVDKTAPFLMLTNGRYALLHTWNRTKQQYQQYHEVVPWQYFDHL